MVRHSVFLVALLLHPTHQLMGQEVRGRIVTEADSTPVLEALLLLLDEEGRERARTTSTPSGAFELRSPDAGRYRVRIQRIGHRGWESPPVDLGVGEIHRVTLRIPETPFQLADLKVVTRRPHCGVTLGDGSLGASVLEAAQTALGLAEAEASGGQRTYAAENYRRTVADRRMTANRRPPVDSARTSTLIGWPVQSADPDSLRVKGFVQGQWPAPNPNLALGEAIGPAYFAPDARVLFSEWFLETHCIALDTTAGRGRRETLVARFQPARGTRDVAALTGQLVFDRSTLGLRLLSFEFVARPRWAPRGSAGGELRFARLADGAWVPASWQLRVPVPAVGSDRYQFYGVLEIGGRVTSVRKNGHHDPDAEAAVAEALSWQQGG